MPLIKGNEGSYKIFITSNVLHAQKKNGAGGCDRFVAAQVAIAEETGAIYDSNRQAYIDFLLLAWKEALKREDFIATQMTAANGTGKLTDPNSFRDYVADAWQDGLKQYPHKQT